MYKKLKYPDNKPTQSGWYWCIDKHDKKMVQFFNGTTWQTNFTIVYFLEEIK